MLNSYNAAEAASAGRVAEMIGARLNAVGGDDDRRRMMLEIALLALAEAARVSADGTPLQHRIDRIACEVEEAIGEDAAG